MTITCPSKRGNPTRRVRVIAVAVWMSATAVSAACSGSVSSAGQHNDSGSGSPLPVVNIKGQTHVPTPSPEPSPQGCRSSGSVDDTPGEPAPLVCIHVHSRLTLNLAYTTAGFWTVMSRDPAIVRVEPHPANKPVTVSITGLRRGRTTFVTNYQSNAPGGAAQEVDVAVRVSS
jgi:hypothetical protein